VVESVGLFMGCSPANAPITGQPTQLALTETEKILKSAFGAVSFFGVGVAVRVAAAARAAHGVRVAGRWWRALEPGSKACQSGCEKVAEAIQKAIGGEVRTIVSPAGGNAVLGGVRNSAGQFVNPAGESARGWFTHTFVVKEGKVYDALTGPEGLTTEAYKKLWEFGRQSTSASR
jgi:hypothetical protein